jgi:TonB family protein
MVMAATCVAACASGGSSSAPAAASAVGLPVCNPEVIAMASSERITFQEMLLALQKTDWVTGTPTLVQVNVKPNLRNTQAVRQALIAGYPARLRNLGRGGEVELLLLVDENGTVTRTHTLKRSSDVEIDDAARRVAESILFDPVTYEGCRAVAVAYQSFTFRSQRR